MNLNDINQILDEFSPEQNIELSDIPMLDLYMDQVIQIFESKFSNSTRSDKEKVLTKTMINNYSKDKLFMATKNKKYTPEHMILLSMIYQLKGSLSISDIKTILNPIVKALEENHSYSAEYFYKLYLDIFKQDVINFKANANARFSELIELSSEAASNSKDFENILLVIMSLVTMSNLYRKTAEKLIDQFLSSTEKF